MAIGMASFTMNDAITKEMSSEMNFGQIMLVRGVFAMLLMGALFLRRPKLHSLRPAMAKPVAWRVAAEVAGTIAFLINFVRILQKHRLTWGSPTLFTSDRDWDELVGKEKQLETEGGRA